MGHLALTGEAPSLTLGERGKMNECLLGTLSREIRSASTTGSPQGQDLDRGL